MDSFRTTVTGGQQVGVRVDAFPDRLYDELRQEIDSLTAELLARVSAATPERTGKLRGEERMRVFTDPGHIKGEVEVSGEFAKAGALEYGAHRPTHVGAHQMRLDHAWGDKLAEPMNVLVGAYTRTPDIEAYAFERGPLAAMQPEVLSRLNAVVEKAVGEANA